MRLIPLAVKVAIAAALILLDWKRRRDDEAAKPYNDPYHPIWDS